MFMRHPMVSGTEVHGDVDDYIFAEIEYHISER